MLRKALTQRLGRHIPVETRSEFVQNKDCIVKSSDGKVQVSVIDPTDAQAVKNYMYKTFYRQAPIPIALQLSRNCAQTKEFLQKELDLFINSGISLKFCDSENDTVLGVGLSTTWKQNPKYEIIGAPVKDWHNAAAQIAHSFPEEKRHIIWRDLQWQHIYDLGLISNHASFDIFCFCHLVTLFRAR